MIALVACGGCDTGAEASLALDGAPPQVLATVPAAGARGVDPAGALRVRFDRAMDAASLPDGIALGAGEVELDATVLYVSATREAVVLPGEPLPERLRVRLIVGPPARSRAGVPLAAEVRVDFVTGTRGAAP